MSEKPFPCYDWEVRAILDGRKTMTRRVARLTDSGRVKAVGSPRNWHMDDPDAVRACPYGQPGDRLWVRETWADTRTENRWHPISYRADWTIGDDASRDFAWRPSIFMPRWASRLTLEVTGVRVERVRDITPTDAEREGVQTEDTVRLGHRLSDSQLLASFWRLWNSINSKRGFGWDTNCWVWVVSFRRVE